MPIPKVKKRIKVHCDSCSDSCSDDDNVNNGNGNVNDSNETYKK